MLAMSDHRWQGWGESTGILSPGWAHTNHWLLHSPAFSSWEAKMAPRGFGTDLLQAFVHSTSIY